jgi:hypothetical protein
MKSPLSLWERVRVRAKLVHAVLFPLIRPSATFSQREKE